MGAITGRIVGASGPTALPVPTVGQVVEDVAALRALAGSVALPGVTLRQFAAAGPNLGGGVFMWDAVARVDDGVLRFNAGGLASNAAGWQRVWDGASIAATWAGATFDGTTDDTAALTRALAVAATEQVPVILASGTLRYTSTLAIASNDVAIIGSGVWAETGVVQGTRLLFAGTGPAILIGQNVDTSLTFTYRTRLEGFSLKTPTTCTYGIRAWCPGYLRLRDIAVNGPLGNTKHCISIEQGVDVALERVQVTGDNETYAADRTTYANGVRVVTALGSPSTTVRLSGVYVHRCYEGLVVDGSYATGDTITIEGCWRAMRNGTNGSLILGESWVEGCGYDATVAAFGYLSGGSRTELLGCKLVGYATPEHAFNVVGTARLRVVGGDYAMAHATPKLVATGDFTYGSGYVSVTDANLNTITYGVSYLAGTGVKDKARRYVCSGSPEGVVYGSVGDECLRTDGGTGTTLYVKESGTGNTGWVAYGAPSADEVLSGDGSPDGVVDGTRGTLYVDTGTLGDAGEATLWVAEQVSGNTGWVPCNGDWEHREPANTTNSVAGWNEDGVAAVLPLPGYVTLPAHTSEAATSTLVTTTTGAGQLIASTALPTDFRGSYRVELTAAGTTGYGYKKWWFECYVHNEGAATAVVDSGPSDIMAAVESGTTVGAATLAVAASSGAVELSVTPANTNSVRWSAIVRLLGVLE